jgi:phosphatidylserine decarboxylase
VAGQPLAESFVLLALLNLAFFRNPARDVPPAGVVSPADGKVVEVIAMQDPDGFVGSCTRVAIFLSVLDVHVNRAPLAAKVRAVRRSGTQFLAAFNPQASTRNVQARLDLETADGSRLAVVQITGLIARRILCYAGEGDELERGAPYGLICYGSRMELYLPAQARVRVQPGDVVRAGETVIAEDWT